MTRGRIVAMVVLAVAILAGTLAQLLHSGPRQTGSNDLTPQQFVGTVKARAGHCQGGETLYAGTRTLRLTIATFGADRERLDVTYQHEDGRVVARGHLDPGWSEGVVDVPITPVPDASTTGLTVCLRSDAMGRLTFGGEGDRAAIVGFGRPGSLLGAAGDIAKRYGYGSASWLGGWTLVLIIVLTLAGIGLAGLALTRHRARYPVVAILAIGTAWALLIPPFMVPDETAHFAYAQGMVETGRLPLDDAAKAEGSEEEMNALSGLHFYDVIGSSTSKPAWTRAEEAELRGAERKPGSRTSRDAGSASANPPLYYLAQAPVYAVTRGASPITSLMIMRLLSVLLGALTIFCVFGFLRELMPDRPLAWSAGSLVVALQPLFGFVTAGVNADAGLFAAGAALFWAAVVVVRHGLTVRRAAALGGVLAAGLLVKPLFLGLVPAGLAALALGTLRTAAPWRRRGVLAGTGLAVMVAPVLLYTIIGGAAFDHPYFPGGAAAVGSAGPAVGGVSTGLRSELVYVWQVFAPRLPFMNDFLPGLPLRDIWFDGFVGRFGWVDYGFERSVTDVAVLIAYAVLALTVAGLAGVRQQLTRRWREVVVLLLALLGVLGAIGTQQYRAVSIGGPEFTQARYLLPLLGLYGALGAVAVFGLGRRVAPYVAAVLVALAAFHDISAMVLTVSRYYA